MSATSAAVTQSDLVAVFDELRDFAGEPREFWPRYLAALSRLLETAEAYFMVGQDGPGWRTLVAIPEEAATQSATTPEGREKLAARAAAEGGVVVAKGGNVVWLAAGFRTEGEEQVGAVVLRLNKADPPWVAEARLRLGLAAQLPEQYQSGRLLRRLQEDSAHAAGALDVLLVVNQHPKFIGAALALCNELVTRFHCERVSLGWSDGRYTKLQAVSHMEKFERRMDAIAKLEAAMDEALDQDEEIVVPETSERLTIRRDHEAYARAEGIEHLLSIPLRNDGRALAALTFERDGDPFSDAEIRALRLIADQVTRRLLESRDADAWFGLRWWRRLRAALKNLIAPEHTGLKLAGVGLALVVAVLIFGRWPYRVEAPFNLRTDQLLHVSAPFDGYIEEVLVRPGDEVTPSAPLLKLDTRKLLIDQSAALADLQRYESEMEKAQSQDNAADMRVARAMAEQAKASLQLTRYRLEQSDVRATFAGVVVEGDLQEKIGAPVKQGDELFKVARLDGLYTELRVAEQAVHEIRAGAVGEIAFVSRPEVRFAFEIERIEPSAVAEKGGNVFVVRGRFREAPAKWWRPGMSGLAKIEVEPRPIWWILLHRLIDFLRMKLWW